MAAYYPLMVRLTGRKCIVVGGGKVAARKVRGLLEAGADKVIVISPRISQELELLAAESSIALEKREYLINDLNGAFLVFAATDSRETNSSIAAAAAAAGALCNVADEAADGDFVTPSAVRRGALLLAATTGGASPALAARIGRELAARYGPEYGPLTARLGLLRERLAQVEPDAGVRRELLRLAAGEPDQPAAQNPAAEEGRAHRRTGAAEGADLLEEQAEASGMTEPAPPAAKRERSDAALEGAPSEMSAANSRAVSAAGVTRQIDEWIIRLRQAAERGGQ